MCAAPVVGYYDQEDRRRARSHFSLIISLGTKYFLKMLNDLSELSLLGCVVSVAQLRDSAVHIMFGYTEFRFIRPFTPPELARIAKVLPPEQILHHAISMLPESNVHTRLSIKSMVRLLCDDFPYLEGLYYSEKIRGIDQYLENANKMDELPVTDYRDLHYIRKTGTLLGGEHSWWSIGNRSVNTINGTPYSVARKEWIMERRQQRALKEG